MGRLSRIRPSRPSTRAWGSDMSTNPASSTFDASGVALSGLCLVHCLALPLMASFLPVAGVLAEAEWVHRLLVLFVVPVSGWVIFGSVRTGGSLFFVVGATFGLALLVGAAFIHPLHDVETPLTIAGATILAFAHGWRWLSYVR